MSHVVSEKSPRALLVMTQQLHDHLNEGNVRDVTIEAQSDKEQSGFILKRVEAILLQIRQELDCPPVAQEDPPPLMMRLRSHVDDISSILTGTGVRFQAEDTTTLYELITCVSRLNASVCTNEHTSFCSIQ